PAAASARYKSTCATQPLYLGRPLHYRQLSGVAVVPLQRVVLHVALGAEDLDGGRGDADAHLCGERLGDGEVGGVLAVVLAFVDHGGGVVDEVTGRLDLDGGLGKNQLDRRVLDQRLAERLALTGVVQGVGDGPLGEAEAAGAYHRAAGV